MRSTGFYIEHLARAAASETSGDFHRPAAIAIDTAATAVSAAILEAGPTDSREVALQATNTDAALLEIATPIEELFQKALWHDFGPPHDFTPTISLLEEFWATDLLTWDFWARWYDGMLKGDPLPWDLQEAVALIPDEIWRAGPERVAERIREIEARQSVRHSAIEVEEEILELERTSPPAAIGHNHPPESISDAQISLEEFEELKAAVRQLKALAENGTVERRDVEIAAETTEGTLRKIMLWAARKCDVAVDAYTKAFWGTAGASTALAATGLLQPLLEKLKALLLSVQQWLALIGS